MIPSEQKYIEVGKLISGMAILIVLITGWLFTIATETMNRLNAKQEILAERVSRNEATIEVMEKNTDKRFTFISDVIKNQLTENKVNRNENLH